MLVHGYSPEGKDDPRVRQAAALLARAGFDVAVPTIPGLTRGRLRPDDVEPVVATLTARDGADRDDQRQRGRRAGVAGGRRAGACASASGSS